MFKFLKEPKFPLAIFVVASLLSLTVIFAVYLIFMVKPASAPTGQDEAVLNRYYLKGQGNQSSDPYISAYPNWEKMLEGPIITSADPMLGELSAPVTITIFSDFSCEYCQQQEETIKKMVGRYGQYVNILRKDFPDYEANSYSFRAAVAGRCAQEQGRYWDYHGRLFSDRAEASDDFFLQIARELDLKLKDFSGCLASETAADKVKSNQREASALEIAGVPFLYVNDQEVLGEIDEAGLAQLVEIEIKKAK